MDLNDGVCGCRGCACGCVVLLWVDCVLRMHFHAVVVASFNASTVASTANVCAGETKSPYSSSETVAGVYAFGIFAACGLSRRRGGAALECFCTMPRRDDSLMSGAVLPSSDSVSEAVCVITGYHYATHPRGVVLCCVAVRGLSGL